MSYWSTSILGGPQALAALARLEDALDLPRGNLYPLDEIDPELRAALNTHLQTSFRPIQAALQEIPRAEAQVGLQVAAALLMAVGARIPPAFRQRAREAIRKDPFRREPERELEMDALARRLATYRTGRPSPVGEDDLTIATGRRRLARLPQPYIRTPETVGV